MHEKIVPRYQFSQLPRNQQLADDYDVHSHALLTLIRRSSVSPALYSRYNHITAC